jgi:hypothetical protein
MRRSFRSLWPIVPLGAAVLLSLASVHRHADADPATVDVAEKAEKCATRVSIAMVGEGASTDLLKSPSPQSAYDTLAKDPRFVERFSRFINSEFNPRPGMKPVEDAAYYMTKYVLTKNKPWTEMFVGKYDVTPQTPDQGDSEAVVTDKADGLGYFRSRAWMVRYAGNETEGVRISTAYRMMQNTIGLKLIAETNAPEADVSAKGRQANPCVTCHYQPWFALDKVATVLGKRNGTGDEMTFDPPKGGKQNILGGVSVANDAELVKALVANEAFDVNACRLAFKYLYGRAEVSCDGPAFDACVAAFKKDKLITTALGTVAKDPNFCE